MLDIKVPVVGESVTEGVLTTWFKENDEAVQADEPLFELETDKITMTVPAEASGKLSILVPAGTKVTIGQVVGRLDTDVVEKPAPAREAAPQEKAPAREPERDQGQGGPPITPPAGMPQVAAKLEAAKSLDDLSPAVRRLVEEHQLDPGQIAASGKGGRLTKEDVVQFLDRGGRGPAPAAAVAAQRAPRLAAVPAPPAPREHAPGPLAASPRQYPTPREPAARQTRTRLSSLRQRIAERLVLAQQTAAILTTFNEVDMTAVLEWRERNKELFQKQHNVRLGFMSFFVKASVDALKRVPMVNAQIQGDEIVQNHFYDIGVAVSTEQGLVVPVVRDCDRLSFAELEVSIADLARRARERTLQLSDLSGGTFTISNGGVYGSLLSTPILNPPQSGILGMHAIKKRPVAVGDEIVVRPMMYLALSYDHRLVDGAQAVTFLRRVAECIESPERMLLEV